METFITFMALDNGARVHVNPFEFGCNKDMAAVVADRLAKKGSQSCDFQVVDWEGLPDVLVENLGNGQIWSYIEQVQEGVDSALLEAAAYLEIDLCEAEAAFFGHFKGEAELGDHLAEMLGIEEMLGENFRYFDTARLAADKLINDYKAHKGFVFCRGYEFSN